MTTPGMTEHCRTATTLPIAARAACVLALVLAMAGCSQTNTGSNASANQTTATTGPAVGATSAAPVAELSTPAAPARSRGARSTSADTAPGSASASRGCPVNASTLLDALNRNTQLSNELIQPVKLLTPSCYDGYATVRTAPQPGVNAPSVLFRFDAATGSWTAVKLGTSNICTGMVPEADIAHLKQCA